jgi:RNA polymerase sigma factor (sigma-70 family)
VKKGSESAQRREDRFGELFAGAYGPVLCYVRRRVASEDAEDVVAEVFFTAWRHLDRAPAEPLPWLYRIAWHAIGNQRRGSARRQRLQQRTQELTVGPLWVTDPADEIVGRQALAAAFDSLTEQDREVLRLVCWEGLEKADAARVLGCSAATFRVRLHRARRRLASLVDEVSIPGGTQPVPATSQAKR